MIAIVDYGMGNLRSVQKALQRLRTRAVIVTDGPGILAADKLVLPGVGAFGACMKNLLQRGLEEPVREFIQSGKPFLGICLGLQVLFSESQEGGRHRGLGILPGTVERFPDLPNLRVPHMGWNSLRLPQLRDPLFEGVPEGAMVYFVHSYFGRPEDSTVTAATTFHGVGFPAAVRWKNVFATQFHPEKSGAVGLRILSNFAEA